MVFQYLIFKSEAELATTMHEASYSFSGLQMDNGVEEITMPKEGSRSYYSASNQQSTMYLETGNACASGTYPYVGCCAVHKKTSSSQPVIPYGTMIYYDDNSVNIGGRNYESFIVEDLG